jgi:hypothetical protein
LLQVVELNVADSSPAAAQDAAGAIISGRLGSNIEESL